MSLVLFVRPDVYEVAASYNLMLKEKFSMHAQSRILGLALTLALVLGLSVLAVAQETAADDPEAAQVTGAEGEVADDAAAIDAAVEEEEFRETLPTVEEQEFTPETLPLLGFVLEKFQQGGGFPHVHHIIAWSIQSSLYCSA